MVKRHCKPAGHNSFSICSVGWRIFYSSNATATVSVLTVERFFPYRLSVSKCLPSLPYA